MSITMWPATMILITKSLVAEQKNMYVSVKYSLRLYIEGIIEGIGVERNPMLLQIVENNYKYVALGAT